MAEDDGLRNGERTSVMPRSKRGDEQHPSIFARASERTVEGASLLFARLDQANTRGQRGSETLLKLAERLRAGQWTHELAELIAHAEAVARTLDAPDVTGGGAARGKKAE